MHWEDEYRTKERVWGEEPSELARAVVDYLQRMKKHEGELSILDIGCGYGRDALYYADSLQCHVFGIDLSDKGIEIATKTASERNVDYVRFECGDFKNLRSGEYDVVCASNLYQLLKPRERSDLRNAVKATLKTDGLFFLSTLSVDDPEHYGIGDPIPGEANSYSFQHRVYIHFCTKEELEEDFAFLNIAELYEHEYDEPRAKGEDHHHISWILIGESAGAGR
jgi:cyclopropane fatty-acyl-phospholipid synthase-like methyltransferase